MKSGSIEREEREDAIFKRLYQLADRIKEDHKNNPQLQEIFFLIMDQRVNGPPEVPKLPVYTDEFKMFTRSQPRAKVQIFLEEMAVDLKTMSSQDVNSSIKRLDSASIS